MPFGAGMGKFTGLGRMAGVMGFLGKHAAPTLDFLAQHPRGTLSAAGAIGGYMMGGFSGALVGAGAGYMTPKSVKGLGERAGAAVGQKIGGTFGSQTMGVIAGGAIGRRWTAGLGMGMVGGFGANIAVSGISAIGNSISPTRPNSSFGQSYGSMMGPSPYGTSFSGMGMR